MTDDRSPSAPQSPIPILFVSTYIGLGGGETSTFEMVRGLDPARWTPHLLCPREGQYIRRWREQGWPVHVIPWRAAMPIFVPAVWGRFPVVGRIAALLRQERIAIALPDFHSIAYVAAACRPLTLPWVWLSHGPWTHPYPWQRAPFQAAAHCFANSAWTRDGFLGNPPFMPPDRVEVAYYGIDTARFRPAEDGGAARRATRADLGIPPDAPVITILGRFQPVKGHLNFMRMAARLAPDYPQARFLVVGDNVLDGLAGDRHKAAIHDLVMGDPCLRAQVIFTGFSDTPQQLLNASDVLVCASDFESLGMAHLEAMACEIPVVSTNVGGPNETVVDGETGFLVPPRDPDALAQAVRRLLDDPDLRARMGRAGRARVLARFTVGHYSAKVAAALDAIVARR